MKIKTYEIYDEVVIEIGKFTILWNSFERCYCDNNCNSTKIWDIKSNIKVDNTKQLELSRILNKRRGLFDQIAMEYVETGLHPSNARKSKKVDINCMKQFLEQKGSELNCGCLLVIQRIRNNLIHGLKHIQQLNEQIELFKAANDILDNLLEGKL